MARIIISDAEVEQLVADTAKELLAFFGVSYRVDVRLGQRTMTVAELLRLKAGDVIPLDRPSSGYVQLVVGKTTIGEAEVLLRKRGSAARIVHLG